MNEIVLLSIYFLSCIYYSFFPLTLIIITAAAAATITAAAIKNGAVPDLFFVFASVVLETDEFSGSGFCVSDTPAASDEFSSEDDSEDFFDVFFSEGDEDTDETDESEVFNEMTVVSGLFPFETGCAVWLDASPPGLLGCC